MNASFDKDSRKQIATAVVIAIFSAAATHLVGWGMEHLKDRFKKPEKKEEK